MANYCYPNPVKKGGFIHFNSTGNYLTQAIKIFDLGGKLLINTKLINNELQVKLKTPVCILFH